MIASCEAQEPARRRRGVWRPAERGGVDLVVEHRVVARIRPTPTGGWFWVGLRRNSTAGPGAAAYERQEQARAAVLERARAVFPGLMLEDSGAASTKPPAIEALDRAQPELASLGSAAAVELSARMNLFCRKHLLGELPEAVTEADVEAIRSTVAVYHRTGAWPAELVGYPGFE